MGKKGIILFLLFCSVCFASDGIVDIKGTSWKNIPSNLNPSTTCTYSLGSSTYNWKDAYFNGTVTGVDATFTGTIQLGDGQDIKLSSNAPGVLTLTPGAADTDIVMNFTGTTESGKTTWDEDEGTFVFGDDTGNALQWNYPVHISTDTDGKGLQIGPQDEGDAGDHPSFLSMAKKFTADTGDQFRGIHNEYQWQAQNAYNIINMVNTAKFTGTATYTQADVRGVLAQLESDNDNVTISSYRAFEAQAPAAWLGGGAFHGTLTDYYGLYINKPTAAVNEWGIYTEGGTPIMFGGIDNGGTVGLGLVSMRHTSLDQLSLEYDATKSWQFRAGSGGALLLKNDGSETIRVTENNALGIGVVPSETNNEKFATLKNDYDTSGANDQYYRKHTGTVATGGAKAFHGNREILIYNASENQTGIFANNYSGLQYSGTGDSTNNYGYVLNLELKSTATIANLYGFTPVGYNFNNIAGTVGTYYGFRERGFDAEDGTLSTAAYNFYGDSHRVDGGSFNGVAYGIFLEEQTVGANNYEMWIDGEGEVFFRDNAIHVGSLTDGHLDLTADVSIDLNAPDVLLNGADMAILDDTPHLTFVDTDDDPDTAYQWHLDTDASNAPWQNYGLYRGTYAGGVFSIVGHKPLMYFDDSNDIYFPTGNVIIDSDSSTLQLGDTPATDYTIGFNGTNAVHTITAGEYNFVGGDVEITAGDLLFNRAAVSVGFSYTNGIAWSGGSFLLEQTSASGGVNRMFYAPVGDRIDILAGGGVNYASTIVAGTFDHNRDGTTGRSIYGVDGDVYIEFNTADMEIGSLNVTANDELLFIDFDQYVFDNDITTTGTLTSNDHDILDDTPHLTFVDTDDDPDTAYQWHLETDVSNAPWQNYGLWRGSYAGGAFSVDPNKPLMYFDDNNNIGIPNGNLTIDTDGNLITTGTLNAGVITGTSLTLENGEVISNSVDGVIRLQGGGGTYNHWIDFKLDAASSLVRLNTDATVSGFNFEQDMGFSDNKRFWFGGGADAGISWINIGYDNFKFFTKVNTTGGSGLISFCQRDHRFNVNRNPDTLFPDPRLRVYAAGSTSADDYIDFWHDQTNANINGGNGNLIIDSTAGNVRVDTTLTVGIDDTGYDVKFYGATAGSYMLWDGSQDEAKMTNADLSFNGTGRINWTKITANGATIRNSHGTTGSTVSDLQTAHDNTFYTLSEESGETPAMDMEVDFTGVTAFNWIEILARYEQAVVSHGITVMLEITPFNGTAWHRYDYFSDQGADLTNESHSFFVPDDSAYINSGVVKVRFVHEMAGTSSNHDLVIDVCALYQ